MNDEFYIGWEPSAAAGTGRTVRKIVVALALLSMLVSIALALCQRMIGRSFFEWGTIKTFAGILQLEPYPHLLVPRPGSPNGFPQFSNYYLVAPWKFGLDREELAPLSGKPVVLKGTVIYRDGQTMVETKSNWIQPSDKSLSVSLPPPIQLGRQTVVGEIVDSKCFLGVMNPGQLAPHRACAIRCISGGIPPVLVVRQKNGPVTYLLLVSAEGKPVNKDVLDIVAEPVEITGQVERQGDVLILRADPATYHRAQ